MAHEKAFGSLQVRVQHKLDKHAYALETLTRIADQVLPICIARKWTVRVLEEMPPSKPANLLGYNVNRGQKVAIRLRHNSDHTRFLEYEDTLGTMLHELVHNVHSPHDQHFYKLLDTIKAECEDLMFKGITGKNLPFRGEGQALGGKRMQDHRSAAIKAAEKRRMASGSSSAQALPAGGYRLGGTVGDSKMTMRDRLLSAAERRIRDNKTCPTADNPSNPLIIYIQDSDDDQQDEEEGPIDDDDEVQFISPQKPRKQNGFRDRPNISEWLCSDCAWPNQLVDVQCVSCLSLKPAGKANAVEIINLSSSL